MGRLHVDPFCISSKYLVDATGHPAEIVGMLKARKPELFPKEIKESFMDVETSEAGVVEKTGEVYPGLMLLACLSAPFIICREWARFSEECLSQAEKLRV